MLSHITKSFLAALLIASMFCHLILPFSGQAKKAAFTFWLSNHISVEAEKELYLKDSILQLSDQSSSFYVLVEQASELVKIHKDKFRLNLPSSSDDHSSARVSLLLLGQWNFFNSQKGNQNAVLPDITRPVQKWLHSLPSPHAGGTIHSITFFYDIPGSFNNLAGFFTSTPVPLAGGISINAP